MCSLKHFSKNCFKPWWTLWCLGVLRMFSRNPMSFTTSVWIQNCNKKHEIYSLVHSSDGSGSKNFDPGRVSHLRFGFEFQKFPLKMSNFSIFFLSGQKKLLRVRSESTRVEARLVSYLLRVKSKLGSGQGPSLVPSHWYLLTWYIRFRWACITVWVGGMKNAMGI